MNIKSVLFVFALLWVSSVSLSAQTLVSTNETITQDTLLISIQSNSISSKTVIASGQAVFSSNSGYNVRQNLDSCLRCKKSIKFTPLKQLSHEKKDFCRN